MATMNHQIIPQNKQLHHGDKCYAINIKHRNNTEQHPIYNSELVDEFGDFRPGLRLGIDYEYVTDDEWNQLKKNGYDIEIERRVVSIDGSLYVEEHPIVAYFSFMQEENVGVQRKTVQVGKEEKIFDVVKGLFLSPEMSIRYFLCEYKIYLDGTELVHPESTFGHIAPTRHAHLLIQHQGYNEKKEIRGLINLGNTCYMNSSLQCLISLDKLTKYFLLGKYKADVNKNNPLGSKGEIAQAYADLIFEMHRVIDQPYSPSEFKRIIGEKSNMFLDFEEEDATEFINVVLDKLHEDLNKSVKRNNNMNDNNINDNNIDYNTNNINTSNIESNKAWKNYLETNRSIITELLHGQLRSTLRCKRCEYKSIKYDPFMYLTLPIPEKKVYHKGVFISFEDVKKPPLKILAEQSWNIAKLKSTAKMRYNISGSIIAVIISSNKVSRILSDEMFLSHIKENIHCYEYNAEYASQYVWLNIKISAYLFLNYGFNYVFLVRLRERNNPSLYYHVVAKLEPFFISEQPPADYESWKDLFDIDIRHINVSKNRLFPTLTAIFKDSVFNKLFGKNFSIESSVVQEMEPPLSLSDCIELFISEEDLGTRNMVHCKKCGLMTMHTKKLDITQLPCYLIVHLKRFRYNEGEENKIKRFVDFPYQGWMINGRRYNLRAICNHIDLWLGTGHYTAYIHKDEWYCVNDSVVSKMESICKDNAYVLFYELEE
ncbi:putative ubiquitin carboxyl-terminal hydrolase 1 [Astathelohania contejeani]|uniref:ubiquitinyl hydrolase 1 n=1 Tax=Astathelohania contejeani TaxID=164912 RepID=A0ABQ7I2D6_9MICR|nr:putative ubiquitin carboxyl-terminal hydrolase 1 [Thelohania contejeani]